MRASKVHRTTLRPHSIDPQDMHPCSSELCPLLLSRSTPHCSWSSSTTQLSSTDRHCTLSTSASPAVSTSQQYTSHMQSNQLVRTGQLHTGTDLASALTTHCRHTRIQRCSWHRRPSRQLSTVPDHKGVESVTWSHLHTCTLHSKPCSHLSQTQTRIDHLGSSHTSTDLHAHQRAHGPTGTTKVPSRLKMSHPRHWHTTAVQLRVACTVEYTTNYYTYRC